MILPYYKQETPFTCALACLRMVLEPIGRKITEYELSKIIGFDIDVGFSASMIRQTCDILGIKCKINFENTVEKLKELVHKQIFPICMTSPAVIYDMLDTEHKHFIVIKDITDKNIIINDPDQEFGEEGKEISIDKFLKAWRELANMLIIVGE